ncbi:MAG: hypothetical protein HYV32_04750 [Candidatus Kerfeldbacteria bacterium]|nr:hypothetical protein [Candidatus Kerfeldbacteria bacterium]
MIDLTNREALAALDPKNVYGSTEMFADQCQQIIDDHFDIELYTDAYKNSANIVLCGMGGSAYGGYIAQSLFHDELQRPLMVNSDYHLPGFVNEQSLVLLSSYSGSTEEPLSCAEEAKVRKANITGFSSGGALAKLFPTQYPGFIFEPKHNPSGQPRLGTGYMSMGTIALLRQLGVISITKEEAQAAVQEVRANQEATKQQAMAIAQQIQQTIPVMFAAEHLGGNVHILRNQMNETAKSFAAYGELPELNHHFMEGLKYPQDKKLTVIFINSSHYSAHLQKRMALTKEVVSKNNIAWVEYQAAGSTKLAQMLNVLSFGGYLSLFEAFIYGLDPSLIPWVDYFKEQLRQ